VATFANKNLAEYTWDRKVKGGFHYLDPTEPVPGPAYVEVRTSRGFEGFLDALLDPF
jgi:hypothetical protein